MHVTVTLSSEPAGVSLVEPENCTAFDVIVHGSGSSDDLHQALAGADVGRLEEGEALVTVDGVRRLAAGSVGAGWEADFLAMLDFARGRGWLTDDGGAIRAHVEWH